MLLNKPESTSTWQTVMFKTKTAHAQCFSSNNKTHVIKDLSNTIKTI